MMRSENIFTEEAMTRPLFEELSEHHAREDGWSGLMGLDELTTAKPAIPGVRNKQAVWTKPEVIVEIEFRGWTEDGQLRHPSFQRVADDRSASEFL